MSDRFPMRTVPPVLEARYRAERFWTGETLGHLLDAHLRASPELELCVWSDTRPFCGTFGELHQRARQFAGALQRCGIGPGDVVSFQLPNWVEAAVCFWGSALAGAVIAPIVHIYERREVGFILSQSHARLHVTAERFGHIDYQAMLADLRPDVPDLERVVTVGADFDDFTSGNALQEGQVDVDPAEPVTLSYTSGTTAEPKGVIHTHDTLVAEVVQRWLPVDGNTDAVPLLIPGPPHAELTVSPVGHVTGMQTALLMPVVRHTAIHLMDQFDPGAYLKTMADNDLGFAGGATVFLTSLLDHPTFGPEHLQRMQYFICGGAPIPLAVAERAAKLGIGMMRAYGSTEHPSVTGSAYFDPEDERVATDGRALPGVELRIVDERGEPVPDGTAGEIQSRGPDLLAGYTNTALNDEAFTGDGWFRSGDVGVLDAAGFLTITDRKKDIIIRGGENISAAEVEELMMRLPGIAEVAVVAAPDARLGEHVCAFVRVHPGAAAPDFEQVRQHLDHAGLSRRKWPEEVRVLDELPRTPSGKIQKFRLREMAAP